MASAPLAACGLICLFSLFGFDNINTVILFKASVYFGFSHGSVGKESACNAGDPGLIPGWR